jgi:hypothetical protein
LCSLNKKDKLVNMVLNEMQGEADKVLLSEIGKNLRKKEVPRQGKPLGH